MSGNITKTKKKKGTQYLDFDSSCSGVLRGDIVLIMDVFLQKQGMSWKLMVTDHAVRWT